MHRRSLLRAGVAIALMVGASVLPLTQGSARTHGRPTSTRRPPARVVSLDPDLGSLRAVVRPGGFLSGPSAAAPQAVALDYLRRHREELGVTTEQLRSLDPATDYVDIVGTHHLSWTQSVHGIRVFHAGLRAAVSNDGRLVTVTGPLASGTSRARATFPSSPGAALAVARRSVGASGKRRPLDRVERIWFATARGLRPAYRTQTAVAVDRIELAIVDARSARVLWHTNLVQSADQVGSGLAWPYYPSSLIPGGGGTQAPVTFPVADATALSGNNAHVFTDVTGRFEFIPRERDEVQAVDPGTLDWSDPAQLDVTTAEQHCSVAFACTWDSETPRSWRTNRRASATNTYWLLNHFHDHLEDAPIGFTEAAGNFQVINDDGTGGLDGDPVMAAGMLGAGLRHGLPVFKNNAFMGTPPDGQPPSMGMFLFEEADYPAWYPFGPEIPSTDAGVDASVVYHEYTHGLSNRLVIYPDGESALGAGQSYAMGEAWSDWYGLDLLTREGSIIDTPAVDVVEGRFVTGGPGIRFQAADCDVDSPSVDCPAPKGGAGPGGYTYGDYGHVFRGSESHSDGEIWVQTLWDLRQVLGSNTTEMLVTRAMELSPPNPSYLDMRNAILDADVLAFAGSHVDDIWTVFAGRGMGFFAESLGGDDESPTQDFSMPPTCPGDVTCGRIEGTVTGSNERGSARGRVGSCQRHGQRDPPGPVDHDRCGRIVHAAGRSVSHLRLRDRVGPGVRRADVPRRDRDGDDRTLDPAGA